MSDISYPPPFLLLDSSFKRVFGGKNGLPPVFDVCRRKPRLLKIKKGGGLSPHPPGKRGPPL